MLATVASPAAAEERIEPRISTPIEAEAEVATAAADGGGETGTLVIGSEFLDDDPTTTRVDGLAGSGSPQAAVNYDSCADHPGREVHSRFDVRLNHWSSVSGQPSGAVMDLRFDFCYLVPTHIFDPPPVSITENTTRAAVEHFVGALQQYFISRGTDLYSPLTDCFLANGPTHMTPKGVSPEVDAPLAAYLPMLGYQMLFLKDPTISILLTDINDPQINGEAVQGSYPRDLEPDQDLNRIRIDYDTVHNTAFFAGVIAHELGHRMGYEHPLTGPGIHDSLIHDLQDCFQDAPLWATQATSSGPSIGGFTTGVPGSTGGTMDFELLGEDGIVGIADLDRPTTVTVHRTRSIELPTDPSPAVVGLRPALVSFTEIKLPN